MKYLLNFLMAILLFGACVDQEFDEPPTTGADPEITTNGTISDLFDFYTPDENTEITSDLIISAIVTADDRSGNFYQTLIIEDETAGISLLIDGTDLYTKYPVGRKVFIYCKGLYIGDYNGLPQIGGQLEDDNRGGLRIGGIASLLVDDIVVKGQYGLEVTPRTLTINDLNDNYLNRLVHIENVEFSSSSAGEAYADAENRFAINHELRDCRSNSLIVRTSGYSDFASEMTPEGNGSFIGVYSRFGEDQQLIMRTPADLSMDGERCNGGGSGGSGEEIGLADLKSLYNNGTNSGPDGYITGVVISDKENSNITNRNLVLQNGESGVVVRFDEEHNFLLGAELQINIGGMELSEFRDLFQVNNVPLDNATLLGEGTLPEPKELTISQLLNAAEALESTLVTIKGVTLEGSSTYSGSLTISGSDGSFPMFTQSYASFADQSVPSGTVDITGIVSQYNEHQLNIRNVNDVVGGTGGGGSGGGSNEEEVSIGDLRAAFGSGAATAPDGYIVGVVISDMENSNITGRNMVLQNGETGIVIRFSENNTFAMGEEVKIEVGGEELSEYNGLLQVNNVPLANAVSMGMGVMPTPRETTIADLMTNSEAWESTLVKISDVTLSGSDTYSGALTVTDASGSIGMFTQSYSSFADEAVPTSPVTMTAIVSQFNDAQVNIRNLDDIE